MPQPLTAFPIPTAFVRACVVAASLLLSVSSASAGRIALHAVEGSGGQLLPYENVRIGEVSLDVLTESGRVELGYRPAQVGAGGRVFAFGKIPARLGLEEFDAEVLVWFDGKSDEKDVPDVEPGWRREAISRKKAGTLGHVSVTLVIDGVEAEPVPTAVFRREPAAPGGQVVRTQAVPVPRGASLTFGYSVDEWDWSGVAPVTLTVIARRSSGGQAVELFRETLTPADSEPRWFDASVDLSELAGEEVGFEFRSTPHEPGGDLAATHAVWSAPAVISAGRSAAKPSVVIVAMDGVRARSTSCCGAQRPVTPFIDALFVAQGAIFDRAVTQSVESLPSMITMLTGLYPSVHGVLTADRSLSDRVGTLATAAAARGYVTAAFTDSAELAPETGAGRGFHYYRQLAGGDPWEVEGRAGPTFSGALEWIQGHRSEPFFVLVHTSQALPPYVPPRGHLDHFKDSVVDPASSDLDEGARLRYEREVRYLDEQLRAFVGYLDRASHPDNTLLVVTSSHGAEFLEHGARQSGTQLYEESIRVPLLMRGAGVRPGSRSAEVIGLVDLLPTVAGMMGANVPEGVQGKSIAKALRSGLPYSVPPRFTEAHGKTRLGRDGKVEGWNPPAYAISQGARKVIMLSGADGQPTFEAYDLVDDSEESRNLLAGGGAPPTWFEQMRQVVESYPVACKQVARPSAVAKLTPTTRLDLRAHTAVR